MIENEIPHKSGDGLRIRSAAALVHQIDKVIGYHYMLSSMPIGKRVHGFTKYLIFSMHVIKQIILRSFQKFTSHFR